MSFYRKTTERNNVYTYYNNVLCTQEIIVPTLYVIILTIQTAVLTPVLMKIIMYYRREYTQTFVHVLMFRQNYIIVIYSPRTNTSCVCRYDTFTGRHDGCIFTIHVCNKTPLDFNNTICFSKKKINCLITYVYAMFLRRALFRCSFFSTMIYHTIISL